ncbi:LOW QUALITY PROTEIN: T-cell receptor beta-1 chain C region [Cynoglossus semilaevis]|uniref:LOW QUALITY PROTEIN: T-cell receptor beta-1 chain C region n=1 Tax=Cynoglossus semilaevis TaxID=244447 RepID=UPI000D62ACF1|nr:LOW QUALITY PROTEIN: T-cell receptor beta-1 chain C region [Cynoglossus semilaevis]
MSKEHDVKEPKVKILGPSSEECRNEKKKTLLCVVSELWQVDRNNVTRGVARDKFAQRDSKFYKITSRLRVSAEDWFNPEKDFRCIVIFFNGENHQCYKHNQWRRRDGQNLNQIWTHVDKSSDSVSLLSLYPLADEWFNFKEGYPRSTEKAKLSYVVFIVKSSIYAAFMVFPVYALKTERLREELRSTLCVLSFLLFSFCIQ